MRTEARERTNSEWVRELRAGGEEQAAALDALRAYLVRAARYALHRSRLRLVAETGRRRDAANAG